MESGTLPAFLASPRGSALLKNMVRSFSFVASLALLSIACGSAAAQSAALPESHEGLDHSLTNQPSPSMYSTAKSPLGEDFAAENDLLKLTNKDRDAAGVSPLRMDESLRAAARQHALLMIANGRLDHNYSGEPDLMQRIAKAGPLKLDYAGENLVFASGAVSANETLMHSPPHRHNLLDQGFNVIGIAAFWSKGSLYVVQDFAHEVPSYSAHDGDKLVGRAVAAIRQQAGLSELKQITPPKLDEAACSLSQGSRPNAHLLSTAYNNLQVIAYTQSRPEILPDAAINRLSNPNVYQFAVGACYARNATYPNGTYWIAILVY